MRAIDIHCHPMTKEWFEGFGRYTPGLENMFRMKYSAKTEDEMAADFRRDDVMAMMIAWDAQTHSDDGVISNDWVAGLHHKYPDAYLPGWAVVDPWKGLEAVHELERAITKLGLTGPKFQPPVQAFFPDDERFFPLYDLCQSLGAPMLIHMGTTGLGTGEPGGLGVQLKFGRPIPGIDAIAANFPRLNIIAAHPAWPWTDELIAVLIHKKNVHFEISGWRPKYIPGQLLREINGRLQDRVMFGSDYPGWNPGQCMDELEQLNFKPGVIDKMFVKNASRLLNLDGKLKNAVA